MMSKLTPLQHGLLSGVILLAATTALYLTLIQPALTSKSKNNERIDELTFQLNKFSNIDLQIKELEKEIDNIKSRDINKGNFLENNAPAIVAADLQKKLKSIIEANGGNLVSTHAITGKKDEAYPKVTIKVHMQVDMKALQMVLYKLTTNKPLLFTDNLLIQRRNVSNKRRNQNAGLVEVRFDVTGYLDKAA